MKPARAHLRGGVLLLTVALACAHATAEKRPADEPPAPRAQPKPGPVEPGHPPLADAPEAMFVPGAIERIQKALAERGYLDQASARPGRLDSATTAAVRKFQSDQGLARTGVPDRETVRRLGLDPDTLFRKNPDRPDSPRA
jgi:peptidoglycan hydrolase-like protein with peptidoglycan-binding domain